MKHNMKISVSKKPKAGGLVNFRDVSVREKVLRFLFGEKQHLTILVPGDCIDEIDISQKKEGETYDGRNQEMCASDL